MIFENRKLGHIGLATTDVEADAKWYQEKLGFKQIGKFLNSKGKDVYFVQNGDTVYEIFPGDIPEAARGKIDHFSFDSDDIDRDYAYCKENGYQFATDGIVFIPSFWEKGVRIFKVFSPTGEEIEFCQIL